jgi:DNA-binding transcriptional regulator YhcF (GntR family)
VDLYYQLVREQEPSPKYQIIRQSLSDAIASGEYQPGQRLPSESELVKTFAASRPTVNKALRELQLSGVIERRAGSGSYVRADAAARGYTFGLLIPELGRTEIFEPICRGMAEAQPAAITFCFGKFFGDQANIEPGVPGMQAANCKESRVFAPLELTPQRTHQPQRC